MLLRRAAGSRFICLVNPWIQPASATFEGRDFFGHGFGWGFPPQCLARPSVHEPCHVVEPGLTGIAQVRALGHELAQEAVGVFVRAALPRGVRIGEPDVDLEAAGQLRVAGQLAAAVMLLRRAAGSCFICLVNSSRAASAVLTSILHRTTKRVLRSTSVPTDERLKAPLMRSPSQG